MLRPPSQPEKYDLKLKLVLKLRDNYIENIKVMSLKAGLKIEGIVKWRGLKSQGPLYMYLALSQCLCHVVLFINKYFQIIIVIK